MLKYAARRHTPCTWKMWTLWSELFDFVLSTERILNLELQTSYSESAIQCTLENQDLLQEDNALVCDEPIQRVHRCRILWHGVEICESCYDSESRSKPSSKSVTMSLQTPPAYVTTQLNAEIAFSEKPQSANYVPKYTYLWNLNCAHSKEEWVVIEKENYRCTNLIRNFCRERLHWKCFWQIYVKLCLNSLPSLHWSEVYSRGRVT